ncbi:MAG: M48 family metalloprotease [bacterium]
MSSPGETGNQDVFYDIQEDATRSIIFQTGLLVSLYTVSGGILALTFVYVSALFDTDFNVALSSWNYVFYTGCGIGAVIAIVQVIWAYYKDPGERITQMDPMPVDMEDPYHEQFQNVVQEITLAAPANNVYAHVLPTLKMNVLTTGNRDEAVIYITEGALGKLKRDELQAVVAHEMAHIVYGDSRLNQFTTGLISTMESIVLSPSEIMDDDYDSHRDGGGMIAALAVAMVGKLLLFLQKFLVFSISQDREWRADATAVEYSRNPLALANALHRIGSSVSGGSLFSPLSRRSPLGDINQMFDKLHFNLLTIVSADDFRDRGGVGEWFHSHPPMNERVDKCLELAHASRDQLDEQGRRMSDELPVQPLKDEDGNLLKDQEWFVHGEGDKPLSFLEILHMGILGPDLNVAKVGEEEYSKAGERSDFIPFMEQGGSSSTGKKLDMDCPDCDIPLRERTFQGVPMAVCVLCGGGLLSWEKLIRVESRYKRGSLPEHISEEDLENYKGYHGNTETKQEEEDSIPCPKCDNQCKVWRYKTTPLLIDYCQNCRLTWFETDELQIGLEL